MLRDPAAVVSKKVKELRQTFAHVYESVQKEALSHFHRRNLIAAEFFKYKKNMDLKETRPHKLRVACMVVVISMVIFVG